ncbi:hypothetical protein OV079_31320 [Nannocystis pusilla]|uniref:Uncharacterized protein n=1 Tax=Nannocystis pusilla TaxID=889268 RepID=A0A9X3EVB1_9BACT|nr:hypothetical protein [Nannocystis pusilla]MCY1009975.1 hypothetical protein [Nannocystis pusilla]
MHHAIHPISALALFFAPAATDLKAQAAGGDALQEIEQARPDEVTVELQRVERGGLAITAHFRFQESGVLGELQLDLWNGLAEAHFSVAGVSHVRLRHVDDVEEHDQVWLSPTIHDELARGAPDVMLVFWAVLLDSRVYAQVGEWLSTLPPDPLKKNPACSVFKWGMKGVLALAGAACCSGSFGFGCATCTLGGLAAADYVDAIDCNKDCKPDCPLG